MTEPYTVLVTGSRNWTDNLLIHRQLNNQLDFAYTRSRDFKLIHGASPAGGADEIAEDWYLFEASDYYESKYAASKFYIDIDRVAYPADLETYGKKGFFLRNKAMIDSKPDHVLGFISGESSRGTEMTLELANKAHIPSTIFRRYT